MRIAALGARNTGGGFLFYSLKRSISDLNCTVYCLVVREAFKLKLFD